MGGSCLHGCASLRSEDGGAGLYGDPVFCIYSEERGDRLPLDEIMSRALGCATRTSE